MVRGYYVPGFPTLKRDVELFEALLQSTLPRVHAKFAEFRVEAITYVPRFLMTLFLHLSGFQRVPLQAQRASTLTPVGYRATSPLGSGTCCS